MAEPTVVSSPFPQFRNLDIQREVGGTINVLHKDTRAHVLFAYDGSDADMKQNLWLRNRLRYFNSNGTMEGY